MEMDTEYERNLSRWESFLKPIQGKRDTQEKKQYDKETLGDSENCLSGQVARKLEQMSLEQLGFGNDGGSGIIKATNIPDDLSKSLSKWKLKDFAHYVNFKSVVLQTFHDQLVADDSEKMKSLHHDILGIFDDQKLESCINRESQARMRIDMLILRICKYFDIQVKPEEYINFNFLPTGKLDYYFHSAEEPLGCLEAKSPLTLDKHAFCQAVMELLLVQKMAERSKWGTASQNSSTSTFTKTPFFCILSDSTRYVLMQVTGNDLYLEHDRVGEDAGEDGVIKIRSIENKEDFNALITSICYLIDKAKKGVQY